MLIYNNKARFVFFYLIPRIIESPQAVIYDSSKLKSRVDSEILFYDECNKAYVHIGITYDENLSYYVPRTFLIEKITEKNDGLKYIKNQQNISVRKISKSLINN
ncbi:hypothetical protein A3Q35_18200 [Aeribacillus pallidus]|nr:hypothetical protein A3Q35_18200 [Aeribacillus pallidus]